MLSKPILSGTPITLTALLVIIISIELILQAADFDVLGSPRWRLTAYEYGAFWPGILGNWKPNFVGQPVTMFFSYAVLHSGFTHLAGNAIMLRILGQTVCDRSGERWLFLVLILTSLAGAIVFAGLSSGIRPMVGTSGAVFGLAGVLVKWQWKKEEKWQSSLTIFWLCTGIVALHLPVLWWNNGHLAWQTHIGGFLAGFVIASWIKTK